ncbi:amidohydrolase family protein [Desulfopila aestuarii]|uniref:Imidazolonepropionase n=1 Tax=Desulfopila aestuarii DSM 18488 TaxID=1121416 RepID=A0A1M7YBQ6_9BACT|nr:amidohydrolase family protein [Desulfopila aestuarii]SHO50009.1 Imidazolonepropionase [Desulfopila aestuarii DSM 18488]
MTKKHCIRAGWLIDGSGGAIQKDVLLTVSGGKIVAIEPYSPSAVTAADSLTDFSYGTLLPPLIDCHVHLAMSGTMNRTTREQQLVAGCAELMPVIEQNLTLLAGHGVLAVRDGGDRENCVLKYIDRGIAANQQPVHIQTPGRAWHRQGRYGTLIGSGIAEEESLVDVCSANPISSGYIKLVNSGLNSLKNFGRETPPQFAKDEIRQLVEMAERQGKKVMVHANGQQPVREAVEAGCHSVEHGFFMGRDNLERMAEHGCVWVPTTCTMKAYAEILEYEGDMASSEVARKNLEHQLGQLRIARQLGVKVALGTDAGSPGVLHGESAFEEMKLLAKAGYALPEIVHCATLAGARLLELPNMGLLAPGRMADFLVARGAPAQLPRKLSYLETIYLGGEPAQFYRKNPVKHVQKRY